jgi:hypothetical protein
MTLLFQYHTFITAEILLELALSANQSINHIDKEYYSETCLTEPCINPTLNEIPM